MNKRILLLLIVSITVLFTNAKPTKKRAVVKVDIIKKADEFFSITKQKFANELYFTLSLFCKEKDKLNQHEERFILEQIEEVLDRFESFVRKFTIAYLMASVDMNANSLRTIISKDANKYSHSIPYINEEREKIVKEKVSFHLKSLINGRKEGEGSTLTQVIRFNSYRLVDTLTRKHGAKPNYEDLKIALKIQEQEESQFDFESPFKAPSIYSMLKSRFS